ncbi:hypothetical protein [Lactiplantibacillus plantarum]|uniref:hypothetical protein n=1 Tax=Lactiplantibacillus plantarum TaxID=1590 RepID=UPI000931E1FB|nr:hypothetical protein [Lactiplantibacillus plantarum]
MPKLTNTKYGYVTPQEAEMDARLDKWMKRRAKHISYQGGNKMNLLEAVNALLKLNKQGVSAVAEGDMVGIRISLDKTYPESLPLRLERLNIQGTKWEDLGMWPPKIKDWQSHGWSVKYYR